VAVTQAKPGPAQAPTGAVFAKPTTAKPAAAAPVAPAEAAQSAAPDGAPEGPAATKAALHQAKAEAVAQLATDGDPAVAGGPDGPPLPQALAEKPLAPGLKAAADHAPALAGAVKSVAIGEIDAVASAPISKDAGEGGGLAQDATASRPGPAGTPPAAAPPPSPLPTATAAAPAYTPPPTEAPPQQDRAEAASASDPSAQSQRAAEQASARSLPTAAQQMVQQIIRRFDGGTSRIELRLDPAELGRIDVRLVVDRDNQVNAHIIADNPATLTDLVRASREIERALTDAGLHLDGQGLSFDLGQDARSGAQADGHAARPARPDGAAEDPAKPAAAITANRWRGHRIDLYA
jgi:flagellar hook-length control protein FliK